MNMRVHHDLTGRCPAIDLDIIPGWLALPVHHGLGRIDQIKSGFNFIRSGIKHRSVMTFDNDKHVARGLRFNIIDRVRQVILQHFRKVFAKDAVRHGR